MKKAANDNTDTWTHLSAATERVLSKIKQVEDFEAGEQQQADRGTDADNNDAHRAERADVISNKKRSA